MTKKLILKNEIWTLIPARSGSKSIKEKNLQKILNFSLLSYAIKISNKSNLISRTFVSTDSNKIKREALRFDAEVPFLRSKKNARDTSTNYDVVLEFVNKIGLIQKNLPKYIMFLLPTTPFRKLKIINQAINKIKKLKNYDSLASVNKMTEPVHKKFFIKNRKLKPIFEKMTIEDANRPRQTFPPSYTFNGYLYIFKTTNILKKNLGKKCFPFIIEKTIDIDNKSDLEFARYTAKKIPKITKKIFS